MIQFRHIFLPALACVPVLAGAQDFNSLAKEVSQSSPAVAADSVSASAAAERLRAENRPEGTELEFEHLWNSQGGHNRWSLSVSQQFLWPGAYSTAGELEGATDRMLRNQSLAYRMQAAADAEALLIDLAAGLKTLEIQQAISDNLDSLMNHYEKSFKAGEATILEVNKLRVERARARAAVSQTIEANTATRDMLQAMSPDATLPSDAILKRLFSSPLPGIADVEDDIMTASALAREAEVEQAKAAERHGRRASLPSISLGYAHAYEDATHFNGLSIGIGLPSYGTSASNRASAAEALATRMKAITARAEENARRRSLISRVKALTYALDELEPAVDGVTAGQLAGGKASTLSSSDGTNVQQQLLLKALKGGQISVIEYLNESNFLMEAMVECVSLRGEILRSIALLRPLTVPAE